MEKLTIDLTPKSFNALLKKLFKEHEKQSVRVRIVNSYKWPNCYVDVWTEDMISNDLRLEIFKMQGGDPEMLSDPKNVNYGNIKPFSIAIKATEWVKLFESKI